MMDCSVLFITIYPIKKKTSLSGTFKTNHRVTSFNKGQIKTIRTINKIRCGMMYIRCIDVEDQYTTNIYCTVYPDSI